MIIYGLYQLLYIYTYVNICMYAYTYGSIVAADEVVGAIETDKILNPCHKKWLL
jgi:hypothetical protein